MKIIVVYKSKTGFSEQYAKWIQTALNCDIIPLNQLKTLEGYDLVIYGAGLMAGKMNGLKDFKPYGSNDNSQKTVDNPYFHVVKVFNEDYEMCIRDRSRTGKCRIRRDLQQRKS